METQNQASVSQERMSSQALHKYVFLLLGIFILIAATYPTAMMRVSQIKNFKVFHFKAVPIEGKSYSESVKQRPHAALTKIAVMKPKKFFCFLVFDFSFPGDHLGMST